MLECMCKTKEAEVLRSSIYNCRGVIRPQYNHEDDKNKTD